MFALLLACNPSQHDYTGGPAGSLEGLSVCVYDEGSL